MHVCVSDDFSLYTDDCSLLIIKHHLDWRLLFDCVLSHYFQAR